MLRNLSRDFAGYVLNTVGLEDIGCRQYLYQLLVGFQQKILMKAFESLRNKFHQESFNLARFILETDDPSRRIIRGEGSSV